MALSRASECLTPESSSAEGLDDEQSTRGESKRKRFHPLRAVRKIFKRRVKREGVDSVSASSKKSRSTSELQAVHDDGHRFQGPAPPYAVGLSVSHDSIFTPEPESPRLDVHDIPGIQGSSLSVHNVGLQGFRDELFTRVRARRDSDDDIGLPHSPCTSPTTVDVLSQGLKEKPLKSHSTCSAGSLASMGSSENDEDSSGHSSRLSLIDRRSDLDADGDVSQPVPLNHKAAHHKIAVRPKRTHRLPRHWRLQQVTNFSGNLPTTPEVIEDSARPSSPQAPLFPELSSFEDAEEPLSLPADLSLCSTSSKQQKVVTGAASEPAIDGTPDLQRKSPQPSNSASSDSPGPIISRSKSAAAELKLRHEINQFSRRQTEKKTDEEISCFQTVSSVLLHHDVQETTSEEVIDVKESMKVLDATVGSSVKGSLSSPDASSIDNEEPQADNQFTDTVMQETNPVSNTETQVEPLQLKGPTANTVLPGETKVDNIKDENDEQTFVVINKEAEETPTGYQESMENSFLNEELLVHSETSNEHSSILVISDVNLENLREENNVTSERLLDFSSAGEKDLPLSGSVEVIVSEDNITTIERVESTIVENNNDYTSSSEVWVQDDENREIVSQVTVEPVSLINSNEVNIKNDDTLQKDSSQQQSENSSVGVTVYEVKLESNADTDNTQSKPAKSSTEENGTGQVSSTTKRVSVEIVPFSQRIRDPNYLSPTKESSFIKNIKQFEDRMKNGSTAAAPHTNLKAGSEQPNKSAIHRATHSSANTPGSLLESSPSLNHAEVANGSVVVQGENKPGQAKNTSFHNAENSIGKNGNILINDGGALKEGREETPTLRSDKKTLPHWEVKIQSKQQLWNGDAGPVDSLTNSHIPVQDNKSTKDAEGKTLVNSEQKDSNSFTKEPSVKVQNDFNSNPDKVGEKNTSQSKDAPQKQKAKANAEQNSNEPELFRVFARRSLKHKEVDKKKDDALDDENTSESKPNDTDGDIINTQNNSTIIRIQEAAKPIIDDNADKSKMADAGTDGSEEEVNRSPSKPSSNTSSLTSSSPPLKARPKGRFHTTSEIPLSEFESVTLRQRKNSAPSFEVEGKENIMAKSFDESKNSFKGENSVNVTVTVKQSAASKTPSSAVKTASTSTPSTNGTANCTTKTPDTTQTKNNKDANLPLWLQLAQKRREMREQRERRLIGDAPTTIVLETSNKPSRSSKVLDMVSNFQKMHLT